MRATTLMLLLALGALIGSVTTTAEAQAPSVDGASGAGEARALIGPEFEVTFDFNATSGPSGEDADGYVTIDFVVFGSVHFHVEGPVVCLNVSANQAVIGFEIDPELSNFTARGALIEVTDDGALGAGSPDLFNSNVVPDPSSCAKRLISPIQEVTEGDIVVSDAPPLPTTRDQCRGEGYQRFGFRNRGQCVAFVQREAKT